ncbi:M20/M25/M40 family metallo-hydrolase [Pelagibacteraceae bacterium]|nr:M20/M25/M40 family metallo-hydrolase [Pelagibacteraceae bacterium]
MKSYNQILSDLISFDTTSRNSNIPAIKYIESLFKKNSNYKIIKVFNKDKNKCSIYIKPKNIDVRNGILFSGHIDTVPTNEQKWNYNPYKAQIVNNKIYGRGSTDMKGFLSVVIHNMLKNPSYPICLTVTHDEETGCDGIKNLLKYLKKQKIILPEKCIVGEPTNLKIVTANKGVEIIETSILSKIDEGHSSNFNQKINTITMAANFVSFLQSIQDLIPNKNYLKCVPGNSSIHIGILLGGTSHNIIPKKTTFRWEMRYIYNDNTFIKNKFFNFQKKIINKNKKFVSNYIVDNRTLFSVLGLKEIKQNKVINFVKKYINSDNYHVAYGTEAGIIQSYGLSTIIFGPGSIRQAHKPNEYINLSQLDKFDNFLSKIK